MVTTLTLATSPGPSMIAGAVPSVTLVETVLVQIIIVMFRISTKAQLMAITLAMRITETAPTQTWILIPGLLFEVAPVLTILLHVLTQFAALTE